MWAALLVLAGMGFATIWAVFLPIFLAPDEDSHYDYALTLYTAGRPMRPAENVVDRDTHPVVEYLMRATHAREQRLDMSVSADAGYGSATYYRMLNARAPKVARGAYRNSEIVPVPYISRLYPVGYYALAALAIAVGDRVTQGSVVGMFFFARYLSVALFASTLWFGWLALVETGLGSRRALLILACIALFPLNAAMAGYVQPDNLAAALIAPILFCALRLRQRPTNGRLLVISGLLLAALIVTKHHYFVAAFVPVAALILVRLPFVTQPVRAWASVSLVVMPSILALILSDAMLVPAAGGRGVCHDAISFTLAAQHGLPAAARFVFHGFIRAFNATFYSSTEFDSFWIKYTAYRTTSLVVVNGTVTAALQQTLPLLSDVVALAFLLRMAQVRTRLLRIGRNRSWRTAAKIATSNVLVNGYLCFFAILFAFEAYSGGNIPVQGRYWFPFLPGLWLCALIVAPKCLPARVQRRVVNVMLSFLVLFCGVASATTFSSLHERFYAPLPRAAAKHEILAEVAIRRKGSISIVDGIAIDLRRASGVEQVVVRLDGKRSLPVWRVDRRRVVCNMEKTLLRTGFEGTLDTSVLRRGRHELAILVRTPWSPSLIDSGVRAGFDVVR